MTGNILRIFEGFIESIDDDMFDATLIDMDDADEERLSMSAPIKLFGEEDRERLTGDQRGALFTMTVYRNEEVVCKLHAPWTSEEIAANLAERERFNDLIKLFK